MSKPFDNINLASSAIPMRVKVKKFARSPNFTFDIPNGIEVQDDEEFEVFHNKDDKYEVFVYRRDINTPK